MKIKQIVYLEYIINIQFNSFVVRDNSCADKDAWNQIPIMLQLNSRFGQNGTTIYNPNKRVFIPDSKLNEDGSAERPSSHKSKTHDKSTKDVEIGEKKPIDPDSPIDVALEEELLERERGKKKSDSEFRGCYDTLSGWISSIWYIQWKLI